VGKGAAPTPTLEAPHPGPCRPGPDPPSDAQVAAEMAREPEAFTQWAREELLLLPRS
jgi:hypothetical protein